jgi:hypothetical protein
MDDLSFEADDESYKALKATLEGSIQAQPDNVLIYATSNRRHLLPESMQDNLDSRVEDGQLHPSDAIEERYPCPTALDCGCRSIPLPRTSIWMWWNWR